MHAEIAAAALAGKAESNAEAVAVVREIAADQPQEVQLALESFLTQITSAVRQSLRRPEDPTGTTIAAGRRFGNPEELVRVLPQRLARFKPGDRPLPGVSWELVELLGVGGFGEVWKARHLKLTSRKPVALKFCLDAQAAKALENEMGVVDRVMAQGASPGIVPLLEAYLEAEPYCLAFQLIEGGDLAGYLQARSGLSSETGDARGRWTPSADHVGSARHESAGHAPRSETGEYSGGTDGGWENQALGGRFRHRRGGVGAHLEARTESADLASAIAANRAARVVHASVRLTPATACRKSPRSARRHLCSLDHLVSVAHRRPDGGASGAEKDARKRLEESRCVGGIAGSRWNRALTTRRRNGRRMPATWPSRWSDFETAHARGSGTGTGQRSGDEAPLDRSRSLPHGQPDQ